MAPEYNLSREEKLRDIALARAIDCFKAGRPDETLMVTAQRIYEFLTQDKPEGK